MRTVLVLLFVFFNLFAEVKTVSVIAQGSGMTRDEAIKNALINALGQVKGLNISAKKILSKEINETYLSVNGSNRSSIKVSDVTSSKVRSATEGFIKSYRVIFVKKISTNEFDAKVKANFAKYKAPGHNPRNRRSLAVLPFEYKNSYTIYSMSINGKELSNRITQSIINKITQTRKFTILDRQNSKYYQFEKSFLKSGDTDPVELARLGKRLGADYFIIGQILDFAVNNETSSNYYTGQTNSKNSAFVTVAYRILNIPTQQIKWSDTIDIEFEVPNAKRTESLLVKIGDKVAQVLVDQIIFNIYPPKIIKISGKNAIVNMGGNVLHMGDRFKVFALGNKLYDPYTKEYLGREEIEIGEVEITAVKPKVSYAKVISGKIKKGAILRKTQIEEKEDSSDTPDGKKESMFEMMFQK